MGEIMQPTGFRDFSPRPPAVYALQTQYAVRPLWVWRFAWLSPSLSHYGFSSHYGPHLKPRD